MFEKFLHQTPFVRFVVPLILGILSRIYVPSIQLPLFELTIILFVVILIMELFKLNANFRINKLFGFFVSLTFFTVGASLVQFKQSKIVDLPEGQYTCIVTITENPEIKENTIKTTVELYKIKGFESGNYTGTKVLAYFQKDSSTIRLKLGDLIVAKCQINETKNSGNPNSFDYKKYLYFKDINYQAYIKSDYFKFIDHNKSNKIILLANNVRQYLLNQYKKFNISGDEFAILSALTLGYKADLSPEIKQSFSASGAMHVLAVSGLHVGIIFFIISNLLFFLDRRKYGRILRFSIIVLSLFGYAVITGLSNSVLRSTFMFTLMCLGDIFIRQKNTYNTIAASAFILLLINPYNIIDVGFQLSYMAVLSIVFFQPRIYSLFRVDSYLPDKIWQLVSVSIAAQIGTLPLTLFYFHQFPVYFIITNIIVIPLSFIIIFSAVVLLLLSFSSPIAEIPASLLKIQLKFFNGSVKWIENLPNSTIRSIFIDQTESFLLLSIIVGISLFMISKRIKYLRVTLAILILSIIYNTSRILISKNETGIIVYNIAKTFALELYSGNKNKLYINKDNNEAQKIIKYNCQPFWDKQGINNPVIIHTKQIANNKLWNTYQFKELKIVQPLSDDLKSYQTDKVLSVDIIIISNGINLSVNDMRRFFEFRKLIIDSSNQLYKVDKWKKECRLLGISYHSVIDQGAFIMK